MVVLLNKNVLVLVFIKYFSQNIRNSLISFTRKLFTCKVLSLIQQQAIAARIFLRRVVQNGSREEFTFSHVEKAAQYLSIQRIGSNLKNQRQIAILALYCKQMQRVYTEAQYSNWRIQSRTRAEATAARTNSRYGSENPGAAVVTVTRFTPALVKSSIFPVLHLYCKSKGRGLFMITKLRGDANMNYIYQGEQKSRGRKRKTGGKVHWKGDEVVSRFDEQGTTQQGWHVYFKVVWSVEWKRNIKVVMITTQTKKGRKGHFLIGCSDLELSDDTILAYYRLRFAIEFLFRDAKQLAGQNHLLPTRH